MRDGGRDLHQDGANARIRRGWGVYVYVRQVHYGEGAKGERVLGVGDGGDEVCHANKSAVQCKQVGPASLETMDRMKMGLGWAAVAAVAAGAGLTIHLLLVNVLQGVVAVAVRVAWRDGVMEGIVEIVVGRNEVVEEACAAIVAPPNRSLPAAGGQVRGVQDGRVGVVLIGIHGGNDGSSRS